MLKILITVVHRHSHPASEVHLIPCEGELSHLVWGTSEGKTYSEVAEEYLSALKDEDGTPRYNAKEHSAYASLFTHGRDVTLLDYCDLELTGAD